MFLVIFYTICTNAYKRKLLIFYLDKANATNPGAEEGNSPRGTFGILDVWRKYRIDSNRVNEWTANLRMVKIVKQGIIISIILTNI